MGTRYIEINSAFRNRKDYPEVSEFIVPFAVDSSSVYNNSYINDAFPLYQFTSGSINATGYMISSSTSFPAVDAPIHVDDAYIGYRFTINQPPSTLNTNLLVTGYLASTSELSVNPNVQPVSGSPIVPYTTTYSLTDTSPFYDGTTDTYSYVVQYRDDYGRIPVGGSNVFAGYFLVFEPVYTPAGIPPSLYWSYTKIQSYDPTTNTVIADKDLKNIPSPPWPTPTGTDYRYTIRKTLPLQKGYFGGAVAQSIAIITTPIPGLKPEAYKGLIFYIIPSSTDTIYPDITTNKMTFDEYAYEIVKYEPRPFPLTGGLLYLAKKINDELYFGPSGIFSVERAYEILPCSRTSTIPLSYSGSLVSQAETVCYEVELLDLILPNVVLTTGSRIIKYPYVYVSLKTDGTDFKVGRNIITSNNPNSYEATFVCGVTNIVDPDQARFVKIDAMGMTQTIKFKPNSTMFFKVYLPDGTPFIPAEADYPSPLPANPLLQIEAIFGVRRV